MKKLYLIRHAKSSWKYPELSDFDRPLNKRGKRDAPLMAEVIKEKKIVPDLIIASSALRTKTTAMVIAKKIGIKKEKIVFKESIYESSMIELLRVIENVDDSVKSLFLVGHNPGLNLLAEYLINSYVTNIPTCAIFAIELDIKEWNRVSEGCGKTLFFDYPKKHISE